MAATDDSLVRMIVAAIQAATAEASSPKGWMLVLGDMNTGTTIYASNLEREGAVDSLVQLIEGLENGTIVPGHTGGLVN